jgi:hypothetical protein
MPNFLVEETTVRHSGESSVLSLGESTNCHLLLNLCVSHVVERQNLDVEIFASDDGYSWGAEPAASFLQKFCCGSYEMILPNPRARFLKAVWKVSRWGRPVDRPLCRFSLSVQSAKQLPEMARHVMAGAA